MSVVKIGQRARKAHAGDRYKGGCDALERFHCSCLGCRSCCFFGKLRAQEFTAHLTGFQELGSAPTATTFPTGAILSDGTGTARLDLDQRSGTVTYTLTYSNVGGTPPLTGTVTQAHIHFGKSHVEGGILVFFCSNLGNGPAGTPTCPSNSGTVTGTWTAASVLAVPTQNVNAGDFDAPTDALTSNTAYANIHQTALPAGEIRGQIHSKEEEEQHERQR